mmetsp:Transcript_89626/g.256051  ORF Transcript_89626/g.256051 Transcript_89626/m.256051 type:complete len:441 (-) Transcript_89626:4713-6035(-)
MPLASRLNIRISHTRLAFSCASCSFEPSSTEAWWIDSSATLLSSSSSFSSMKNLVDTEVRSDWSNARRRRSSVCRRSSISSSPLTTARPRKSSFWPGRLTQSLSYSSTRSSGFSDVEGGIRNVASSRSPQTGLSSCSMTDVRVVPVILGSSLPSQITTAYGSDLPKMSAARRLSASTTWRIRCRLRSSFFTLSSTRSIVSPATSIGARANARLSSSSSSSFFLRSASRRASSFAAHSASSFALRSASSFASFSAATASRSSIALKGVMVLSLIASLPVTLASGPSLSVARKPPAVLGIILSISALGRRLCLCLSSSPRAISDLTMVHSSTSWWPPNTTQPMKSSSSASPSSWSYISMRSCGQIWIGRLSIAVAMDETSSTVTSSKLILHVTRPASPPFLVRSSNSTAICVSFSWWSRSSRSRTGPPSTFNSFHTSSARQL